MRDTVFNILLLAVLLLTGVTCERMRTKQPKIDGFLLKLTYPTGIVFYGRQIDIYDDDALPQIPIAELNGRQLPMVYWNPINAVYQDMQPFKTDTVYKLDVTHYWGEAHSTVNMPGDFALTNPESAFVLRPNMPLLVSWHKSPGASWYWLNLYLDFEFYDTLGEWNSLEFDRDTLMYDTVCVYDGRRFFPDIVRQVIAGEGEAVVMAMDGTPLEPGALGNVMGDAVGYYNGANQPNEAYFVIVSPPAVPRDRTQTIDRLRDRLVTRLMGRNGVRDTTNRPRWR